MVAAPASTQESSRQESVVTTTTNIGTIVVHKQVDNNDRSGKTGIILRVTTSDQSKLDIAWTDDGTVTSVAPDQLLKRDGNWDADQAGISATQPSRALPRTTAATVDTTGVAASFYAGGASKGYKSLLPSKLPEDLICPLDSVDPIEVQTYQWRMDNFLCSAHPRIRQIITGDLEPPLLIYEPYLEYKRHAAGDTNWIFDHASANEDIKAMRAAGRYTLADECDMILDNPPAYDGFRPCNSAVFHSLVKSLRPRDLFIMRKVKYGDGIGLRNTLWTAMTGDATKSKKLMAMTSSVKIEDIKYRFVRHGISKYFSEIHRELAKLEQLGAKKQDWEVFSSIFEHMSSQCIEYRKVVTNIRDKLADNEDAVTLRTIERDFTTAETVHRIGTENRGTPLDTPVRINRPPLQ